LTWLSTLPHLPHGYKCFAQHSFLSVRQSTLSFRWSIRKLCFKLFTQHSFLSVRQSTLSFRWSIRKLCFKLFKRCSVRLENCPRIFYFPHNLETLHSQSGTSVSSQTTVFAFFHKDLLCSHLGIIVYLKFWPACRLQDSFWLKISAKSLRNHS